MRGVAICAVVTAGCFLAGCSAIRQPASPDDLYRNGEALLQQGRLEEALAAADSGLRVESSWRFRLLKIEALLSRGRARDAIQTLDSVAPPDGGELGARWLVCRSRALEQLADYAGAQGAIDRAQAMAKSLNLPLLDAEIALRFGNLNFRRHEIAEAESRFREVMSIAAAHHDLYLQAIAAGSLGVLFLNEFRYEDAIYWEQRAHAEFERIGSADSTAKTLGNLGWCYYRLGDFEKALAYSKSAEAQSRESGNQRDQEIWLGNIGSILFDSSDVKGAIAKYQAALELAQTLGDKRSTGVWMYNLGLAYIKLGDFDAAERYNSEALRLKNDLAGRPEFYPDVSEARIALGRKQFDRAETLYHAVLAEAGKDPTPILQAKSDLADLFVQTGAFERADQQFQSTIAFIERRRAGITSEDYKLSYLASLMEFYQRYVDFLVTRGSMERALEAAESSRARVLDEKISADANADRAVHADGLKQMSRSSGAVLLSYWLAPERSFLFAVTPNRIEMHELPGEKQIGALVEAYRSLIEGLGDPLESELPAGARLSTMLLGPVRPLLGSGARVIVVPDRALHSLNFETLPDPENPSRYFIDRATMSVAPSLGVLLDRRKPANAQRSILLIGNPEPAVEEYPRLPYAAQEMNMIARDFPAADRVAVEGARAYPAAYRESEPSRFAWIHFAAHATANAERPLDSALILSRRGSGYALAAREIMDVPLNADLVTLSACRGAGAKTYSGEGLVGLSWAFLRAGARSVVAGLWDVNDMSTANLMGDFYTQLTAGVAPAEALRTAKLGLIRSKGAYRKPFYWGPFQLYIGVPPALQNHRVVRN
jgi:tetratricopeptide (TPR) repeat protein